MHQPFTGETFYGTNDRAAYRHGGRERVLRTRSGRALDDAVLCTTTPRLFRDPADRAAFERLEGAVRLSKYGGDCYLYGMLATGYVDLATDATLNPYDIQALMPIIRGAGGVVSTYAGGDASLGGTVLASANQQLHELALARMMKD